MGSLAGIGTGIVGLSYGPFKAPCLSRGIQYLPLPSLHGLMWEQLSH